MADLPKTIDHPRRCSTEGCTTMLSRYNRTRHCSVHGGWRRSLGLTKTQTEAMIWADLVDVMEEP